MRILVVDDHPLTLELLSDRLDTLGHEVITASSGPEALTRVAADLPDLVLMDVMMPDMDGFEATRRLKAGLATGTIPIVLLTALSSAEDELQGRAAGADGFLRKPFHKQNLIALLEQFSART